MRLYPRWLKPIDNYWWQADWPHNLAYIHYLFVFEHPPDIEAFLSRLEPQFFATPRFRSRIVAGITSLNRPAWQIDPDFDLRNHVHQIGVPAPGDEDALRGLISDLASQPFAAARVPWEMYFIDGVRMGEPEAARQVTVLFGRIHHCVADGVALMQLMQALIDQPPTAPEQPEQTEQNGDRRHGGLLGKASRLTSEVVSLPVTVARGAATGAAMAASVGRIILSRPDPACELKQQLGVAKRLAWTPDLPLAQVKAVSHHFDATCNDVIITLIAGGLRRYLVSRGVDLNGLEVRPFMPINLRDPAEARNMGNGFGLLMPYLPLHLEEPVERLGAIHARLASLKQAPQAVGTYYTMVVFGFLPRVAESLFLRFIRGRATMVVTNLIGPRAVCSLGGSPVDMMVIWAPAAALMPLSISIFSYAGAIRMGIQSDAGIIADPIELGDGIMAEWEALQHAARLDASDPVAREAEALVPA